jgi:hypothetical protein
MSGLPIGTCATSSDVLCAGVRAKAHILRISLRTSRAMPRRCPAGIPKRPRRADAPARPHWASRDAAGLALRLRFPPMTARPEHFQDTTPIAPRERLKQDSVAVVLDQEPKGASLSSSQRGGGRPSGRGAQGDQAGRGHVCAPRRHKRLVGDERLGDDFAHAHAGIERGVRTHSGIADRRRTRVTARPSPGAAVRRWHLPPMRGIELTSAWV